MDPYNNNPFATDDTRESKSEYAANVALARTVTDSILNDIADITETHLNKLTLETDDV